MKRPESCEKYALEYILKHYIFIHIIYRICKQPGIVYDTFYLTVDNVNGEWRRVKIKNPTGRRSVGLEIPGFQRFKTVRSIFLISFRGCPGSFTVYTQGARNV